MMEPTDKNLKGHLSAFLANLMWGLNAPIGKVVLASFTALSVTTFRIVGAAAAFWIFSLFRKKEKVGPADMLKLFFAALFGIIFNQGLYIFGLSYTSPINTSIIATMTPIVTMIVAAVYMREPITGKKVAGVFMGAVGALILVLGSHAVVAGGPSGSVLGDLLVFLSTLSFSLYLTLFKGLMVKYSPVTISKWMFTYATLICVPFAYNDLAAIDFAHVPPDMYLRIAFVVFGATFIAYISVQTAQKLLRPTVVSMYNYVQPIVASVVAVLFGMDVFGWAKGLAIVLVFAGVYVVTQSKSRAQLSK